MSIASPTKKRKRTQITNALRHEICIYSNDNNTATSTDIASYFNNKYSINIDRSTVSKILSTKDRWIDLNLENQETSVVRHRNVKFPFHDLLGGADDGTWHNSY